MIFQFDFILFKKGMLERELEDELVKNVTKLLLELDAGFALIGNQYHLEVSGRDFYIDLLFYNLTLRCYVITELKIGDFEQEYAGSSIFIFLP
jgi:predicted nuclease of restriction endonuclease-like (RecB) superfamily